MSDGPEPAQPVPGEQLATDPDARPNGARPAPASTPPADRPAADPPAPAASQVAAPSPGPAPIQRGTAGAEPLTGEIVPVHTGAELAENAEEMSETIAALADEELPQAERRRLLGRLAAEVRARGVGDLFRPKAAVRWMADAVGDVAPHLPIRSGETLRRHFPGLTDDELAERLVRNAARTTAAVGAASGGVAAIEWVATPSLLTAPVLLATETVAVVAIEVKLIGELHEIYSQPIVGTRAQRGVALLQSWANRRGVNPLLPGVGVTAVLGTAARKELRDRLLRRFGRNLTTYGPMLTGAAVASYLNRRATIALGDQIRKDLRVQRRRQVSG